jgi:hypothetical protein
LSENETGLVVYERINLVYVIVSLVGAQTTACCKKFYMFPRPTIMLIFFVIASVSGGAFKINFTVVQVLVQGEQLG